MDDWRQEQEKLTIGSQILLIFLVAIASLYWIPMWFIPSERKKVQEYGDKIKREDAVRS